MKSLLLALAISISLMIPFASGDGECGWGHGDALCPNHLCCSEYGWCGATKEYCGDGCQSQCDGPPPPPPPPPPAPLIPDDLSSVISREQFEEMLPNRNQLICLASDFYTYDDFLAAAKSFPSFGNSGDDVARKREVAAFFGQTAHETAGRLAEIGSINPYKWGYCIKEEIDLFEDYCKESEEWPCALHKRYFGRGPIQLKWNYNYGQCGKDLDLALLKDPDLVAVDGVVSFQTALWFWMTPKDPKPSCHDVITGQWAPSADDQIESRVPGYGAITNIINGWDECGRGQNSRGLDRIGFYKRFCEILGVTPGDNLDCYTQAPFSYDSPSNAAI